MSSSDEQGKPQQTPKKYHSRNRSSNSQKTFASYTRQNDFSSSSDEEASAKKYARASYLKKQNRILSSSDEVFSDVPETPTKYSLKSNYHSFQAKKYRRTKRCTRTTSTNYTSGDQNSNECMASKVRENCDDRLIPQSNNTSTSISSNDLELDTIDDNERTIIDQLRHESGYAEHRTGSESSSSMCSTETPDSAESSTESGLEDNEQVGSFDKMLYNDSEISTGATYLLILKFCTKYKLSRKAQSDLLQLIRIICPKDAAENIPKSYRKLVSKMIPSLEKVEKQMICLTCNQPLKSGICNNGHAQPSNSAQDNPHFYNIPLEPQLQMLLEGKNESAILLAWKTKILISICIKLVSSDVTIRKNSSFFSYLRIVVSDSSFTLIL